MMHRSHFIEPKARRAAALTILLGAFAGCGADGSVDASSETPDAGADVSPVACGDGSCSDGEDCGSCESDCGVCLTCDAPSCTSAATPIAAPQHRPELEGMIQGIDGVRARLLEQIERGDARTAVLLAALDTEGDASDPAWMHAARRAAAAHPALADKLRARLASAGIDRPRTFLPERVLHVRDQGTTGSQLGAGEDPPGSTLACGKPYLRIRASKLKVYASADLISGDDIYCVVSSEAVSGSEVRVTPLRKHLLKGAEEPLALAEGLVWGSVEARAPEGGIVLTYHCLESSDYSEVNAFLDDLKKQFEEFGGLADSFGYGWVVDAAQGVLGIIEAALSLDTDDVMLSAQQTLYPDTHYDLAKGVWWEVRRSGKVGAIPWDYSLIMEAWGCGELAE